MGALQAAGAEEAEHLAAQQQRELQEAIAQEKKALAALERWVKCDCHRYNVRIYVCTYVCMYLCRLDDNVCTYILTVYTTCNATDILILLPVLSYVCTCVRTYSTASLTQTNCHTLKIETI